MQYDGSKVLAVAWWLKDTVIKNPKPDVIVPAMFNIVTALIII